MDTAIRVQILDEAVSILFHANAIRKKKALIHLFFFQLWVNSRADLVLLPWYGNQSRKKKLNSNQQYSTEKLILCHILPAVDGVILTTMFYGVCLFYYSEFSHSDPPGEFSHQMLNYQVTHRVKQTDFWYFLFLFVCG